MTITSLGIYVCMPTVTEHV